LTDHPAVDVDHAKDNRLRALVRDKIRRRIVDGRVPPGARLVERNLAAELGVSGVPVREALRDLVAEGYAVNRATRGIAVRSYPEPEIDELFEIRRGCPACRGCAGSPATGPGGDRCG
jgi:DNA-binding GntR family transcriptional regulator